MKNQYSVYRTKGMVIATVTVVYSCCTFLASIATLLSYFLDPTFLGLVVFLTSCTITVISFVIAYITYYYGEYIALETSHFVIKTASKRKKTILLWEALDNVVIDKSKTLHLLLKDGTSYQFKQFVNMDELLIDIQKHT